MHGPTEAASVMMRNDWVIGGMEGELRDCLLPVKWAAAAACTIQTSSHPQALDGRIRSSFPKNFVGMGQGISFLVYPSPSFPSKQGNGPAAPPFSPGLRPRSAIHPTIHHYWPARVRGQVRRASG